MIDLEVTHEFVFTHRRAFIWFGVSRRAEQKELGRLGWNDFAIYINLVMLMFYVLFCVCRKEEACPLRKAVLFLTIYTFNVIN
jgi:hypothetical protein